MDFLIFTALTMGLIAIPAALAGIITHLDTWGR